METNKPESVAERLHREAFDEQRRAPRSAEYRRGVREGHDIWRAESAAERGAA